MTDGKNKLLISYRFIITALTIGFLSLSSCSKFLEVESPVSKIPAELVFADDAAANSAVIGMYISMMEASSFAAGSTKSVVMLAGLSADELVNIPNEDQLYLDFQKNNISTLNDNVLNLWGALYKSVYSANSILEGLSRSTGISESGKNQFRGEALFIRAFCYFYLTNFFSDVPIIISTDYNVNARLDRSSVTAVYDLIKTDLIEAEDLLPEDYVGNERIRPNRFTATALLARVYLYTNDLPRCEDKAAKVIDNPIYSLTSLNSVFLANSSEAIWQLRPLAPDPVANEAIMFSFFNARSLNGLNSQIAQAFQPEDQRKTSWIIGQPNGNDSLWLPYKYKRAITNSPLPHEYSMVLRLAEMYLIRAEARARQEKLAGAIADIDELRKRAGVAKIADSNPDISQEDLLLSIENERKLELFTEWGHRWFDLKRLNRATAVLSPIKEGLTENDLLYPIPEAEIRKNSNLRPQNSGY